MASKNTPVVKSEQPEQDDFVSALVRNAIENRASDIHIDPTREGLQTRFRVDGLLYPVELTDKYPAEEVVSRIKVMSQMDILEHRNPQDGHFEFTHKWHVYNVRASTAPTLYGEAIVLRILNREDSVVKLENLGLAPDQLEMLNKIIINPYGLLLITGPTGSGKTTLLYSILDTIKGQNRSIITIEDPVEFQMQNIRQIPLNESTGFNFAKGMRTVMRQDPDVIMLGEIRDAETAQMVLQAALAGVLLFSTFHTFDVPGLVIRLTEMNIPRSVIAHSIIGIASSRLARKICASCSQTYEMSEFEKKIMQGRTETTKLSRGKGCAVCRNSGYIGRTGIFEIVPFDQEARTAIVDNMPVAQLRQLFNKKTSKSLWDAGLQKVAQGETTFEEIIRVVGLPM